MSDVPLKEHIEVRLAAMKEAVDKAEKTLNQRLEGMNEFRDTLKDQASRLATKDEVGLMLKRVEALELTNSETLGRTKGIAILWAIGVSLVISLLLRVFKL